MSTKKISIIIKVITLMSVLFAANLSAQNKTIFSIETDPATFAFSGYAFHARVAPAAMSHWAFGAGIYAMDFPDILVDMNPDNKDKGWDVRLNQGLGLFAYYYFNESKEGWFVGNQVAIQEYEISNDAGGSQKESFTNLLIMPLAGYRWRPMNNGFYIDPWMGIGYTTKLSGKTKVADKSYKISPIIPFMTVHIGYEF